MNSPFRRVVTDKLDLRILAALHRDGRMTKVELSEAVGLSASRCCERMKRLEKVGLIQGFRAQVDMTRIAPCSQFLVQVKILNYTYSRAQQFQATIERIDEIVSCQAVLGAYDYLMTVMASSVEHYQLVIERLQQLSLGDFDFVSYPVTKTIKSFDRADLLAVLGALSAQDDEAGG